ncbi:MAG TPA: hypothetical protein VHC49_03615 [Mycobacteriales bacterium]|nr:hypothetical protein [Mycobacteriales bacterium]
MSWPFDTSRPIVTAAHSAAAEQARLGITPEDHALPPLMVGTFQRAAYERLLDRAGVAPDAEQRTSRSGGIAIQSTSMIGSIAGKDVRLVHFTVGAPAVAIALEIAIARGVRDVVVVGSAGGLHPDLRLGSTVVVDAVAGTGREDGTSHHYAPAGDTVRADADLTERLVRAAENRGVTPALGSSWTTDAPYRECVDGLRRHRDSGALVVEMEAATIFAVARARNVRAGLIVATSDELSEDWLPGFSHPDYLKALIRAADIVMDAVATT